MQAVSIAQEILTIVESCLPEGNRFKVNWVKIELGEFSNILPEPLEFGFEVLSKETRLSGARLLIEKIPLTVKCSVCGIITTLTEPFFYCPLCDSPNVEILTGTEMKVIEIEINEKDDAK